MKYFPLHFKKPLLYIGDGHDRVNVKVIPDRNGINGLKIDRPYGHQYFRWPNGEEFAVPRGCVVIDTPEVRREKGLE